MGKIVNYFVILVAFFLFSCATQNSSLSLKETNSSKVKKIQENTISIKKIRGVSNEIKKVELGKIESEVKKDNENLKNDAVVFEFRNERYLEGIETKDINEKIVLAERALQATFKMLSRAPSTGMEHLKFNQSSKVENINYNFENFYSKKIKNSEMNYENTVLILLPISNKFRVFGEKIRKSIDLGILEEENSNVKFIYFDTGTEFNLEALDKLIRKNNPRLIIGPLLRETLIKIVPIINYHRIPIISFTNDTTLSKDGIWTLGYSPYEQIMKIIDYSIKCKKKDIGFISIDNDYGKKIFNLLARKNMSFSIKDSLFIKQETIKNKDTLNQALSKFLRYEKANEKITTLKTEFELIFLIGDRNFILEIVPMLTYYDLDLKSTDLFSTSVLNEKTLLNEHSLINAKFPFVKEKNISKFNTKWNNIWKNTDSDYLTRLGYYVSKISIWAATQKDTFINLISNNKNKFSVLGNKFTFLPDGKVLRPSMIYKINSNGKVVKVKNCQ